MLALGLAPEGLCTMSAQTEEYLDQYQDFAEPEFSGARRPGDWLSARDAGQGHQRSLALGIVAMTPLLIAYELGLAGDGTLARNHAELTLLRALAGLGDALAQARQLLVLCAVLLALALCFRRRLALGPSVTRLVFEGALGALLIGPALALFMNLVGDSAAELSMKVQAAGLPPLAAAARLAGGAAYEELLFRVLFYGGLFVVTRRVLLFFGGGERLALCCSEVAGLVGSSLAFAALHLESVVRVLGLGLGGESYSASVFLWRTLAGVLLALLFRWRGPGVAAWTHALFNLALFLGAGLEVLL